MMSQVFYPLFAVILCTLAVRVETRRHNPLIAEENHVRNRAAECTYGKQVKEIGSSWFADLGPPFGVMYCIKCECVRVQKKRRVVARVQCRNIKNECPKPTCDEPVLLPGRCCKSCPGDFYSPDIVQDVAQPNVFDEEEKSTKHFASLLTGRSSLVVKREDLLAVPVFINKNNVIATGRFTFHRKNLYYSFYVSDKAARPRSLQFVDHQGNILDEHILSGPGMVTSLYQNVTRKVCGVWKRLPRDYRRLLKDEQLFAVLVWGQKDQAEFTLSGQIMRYVALGTELFSSLLEPAPGADHDTMIGAGGTAIVSISSSSAPSIHIAVVFNGIFSPDEISDVPINITLSLEEKQQNIIEEVKRVKKPAHELNIIEVSSPVTAQDLRHLTRGRLILSISSVHKPEALRLTGAVITRATCELFQSALTPNTDKDLVGTPPSGLAWLFMNSEGALVYSVRVEEVQDTIPTITLVDIGGKRKTELEDLTPYYLNGWANGTLDRLGPRVLEPLYSGNLAVNVATPTNANLVRGRLIPRPVAEARDSPAPILLKREGSLLPSSAVGIGWISVDIDCNLHYDLTLNGAGNGDRYLNLYLQQMPLLAPGAPVRSRHLEEFKGNQLENSINEQLTQEELILMETGVKFLEVRDKDHKQVLLKGIIRQIKVPANCLPHFTDNDVPTFDRPRSDTEIITVHSKTCYHEGRFYEEGQDWTTNDPCTICFCQNGHVKCDVATCPPLKCATRKADTGECCPPCADVAVDANNNTARGCYLGSRFHSVGSKWYPFLVPSGFDHCTECSCDPITLEVKCTRQTCVLDCDEQDAVRVDDKSCCKQCPDPRANSDNGTYQGDHLVVRPPPVVKRKSTEEIVAEGGCKSPIGDYIENGKDFNPRISSFGEIKCVKCKCKNGVISCDRVKCNRAVCNSTTYRQRRNSGENNRLIDRCCSCKRYRRHHNHRQHHQREHRQQ